jgi:hypothetical protein
MQKVYSKCCTPSGAVLRQTRHPTARRRLPAFFPLKMAIFQYVKMPAHAVGGPRRDARCTAVCCTLFFGMSCFGLIAGPIAGRMYQGKKHRNGHLRPEAGFGDKTSDRERGCCANRLRARMPRWNLIHRVDRRIAPPPPARFPPRQGPVCHHQGYRLRLALCLQGPAGPPLR